MMLSVLIVVLHYNGVADTLECLASLSRQDYAGMRTVVIDNGSVDKLDPDAVASFQGVRLIQLAENTGWSGGNNVGIRLGLDEGVDFICLLNNDTIFPDGAVTKLMRTAADLGVCILHPAIDSHGLYECPQLDPTGPYPPGLRSSTVSGRPDLFRVEVLNGACVFIHADIFRQIGLIDDRFFLLCEDSDLGRRAAEAGYERYCDVSVRIIHKESKSFGGRQKPIKTYYSIRNMLFYSHKHEEIKGSVVPFLRYVTWTIWNTARASGARVGSWPGLVVWCLSRDRSAKAIRMGLRDFFLGRMGRVNPRDEALLTAPERRVPGRQNGRTFR